MIQVTQCQEARLPRPSWPPTEAHWNTYRCLITQLYIDQDLTLDSTRNLLQTCYGFKATVRMYKAHFKRWELKKYFSAQDKEAVAQLLDVYRCQKLEPPETLLNGFRVPLHLVRRHCRRSRIYYETCQRLPYIPLPRSFAATPADRASDALENSPQASSPNESEASSDNTISALGHNRPIPLTTNLDRVQNILTVTSQYFDWHLGKDLTKEQFKVSGRPSAVTWARFTRNALRTSSFWKLIACGLELLIDDEPAEAWNAFNKGCGMVKRLLREQHRGLLKHLFLIFSDTRWKNLSGLRSTLLQFLYKMSATVNGEQHPLSIVIRLCKDPEVLRGCSQRILNVILDSLSSHQSSNTVEIGQLRRAHCDILRMNEDYANAEREAEALVSECEMRIESNLHETLCALRLLAHIFTDQHRYNEAKSVHLNVIEKGRTNPTCGHPEISVLFAYENLACILGRQGDIEGATACWRTAADLALRQGGVNHLETQYCQQSLQSLILCQPSIAPKRPILQIRYPGYVECCPRVPAGLYRPRRG